MKTTGSWSRIAALACLLHVSAMAEPEVFSDRVIVKTARVAATRDVAWRAWTDESELPRWFGFAARVELRPGGPYEIYFLRDEQPGRRGGEGNTVQSYLPGQLLAFTWNAPPSFGPLREIRTHVLLQFADLPGGGTEVKLTHFGFRPGEDWAKVHEYFENAWGRVLGALENHLGAAPAADPQQAHDQRMDYVEFVAPDLEAAKKFYAAAFGWRFTDFGPDYTSFADGRLSGGFRRGEKAAATNPLIVIFARDLESAETKVRAAGGAITVATHTFPGGRRFHFTDPNGIELAVWSDRTASGAKIE